MTRVLVNPLDWGLGHATRCVPLVHELLRQGCDVILGSTGLQRAFFSNEFPELPQIAAPSYQIQYPSQGWQMPLWILREAPRLRKLQQTEHLWTEQTCKKHGIQWVISDNRFGCYSKVVHSTYITHQNRIAFPSPFRRLESWGERWHHKQQRNFQEVWIPDFQGENNLAGSLSQSGIIPGFHHHIGPLTRFAKATEIDRQTNKRLGQILALLSGPEPQRTLLEKRIISVLSQGPNSFVILQGKPGTTPQMDLPAHGRIYSHLPSAELRELILQSEYILCRSGYSTLMDLQALGSKAVLIPTPGQTEQELLGRHLRSSGQCGLLTQQKLSLQTLQQELGHAHGFATCSSQTELLSSTITQTLQKINTHA